MKIIHKLKLKALRIKEIWSSFKTKHYSKTEKSIVWLFNLLSCVIIGSLFIDSGLPKILSFLLFGGIAFLIINLFRIIVTLLLKPLFNKGVKPAVYTIMILFTIFLIMYAGSYIVSMPLMFLLAILITIMEFLFVKSIWSLFICKRRTLPIIISLIVTVTLNIIMGFFLSGEGIEDSYINSYLSLSHHLQNKSVPTFYNDIMEGGNLSVRSIEYGRNKDADLASETTNLSPYIENYQGISSMIRGLYWDYDIDQVPLAGKIWYPTQGDNYPVLFIIHGNHSMTTKSYLGYDYLGEYLASYGYVVVSVDEAFCNAYIDFGLFNENDARAILLLENMKQIEAYNKDQNCTLFQKMDFSNIALAGHSRGGESVATASLFNNYQCYPDNGNLNWDYHYNIKTIIAIAPTCDQYQPAKHEVQLNNINYLLIHGSNDQDVTNFMGYRQYHNITFSPHNDAFKAYLYITGANHGQFNTNWGRYDLPVPFKPFLNTRNLLDAEEQRTILKTYTKVFLDVTLKKDNTYKILFKDNKSYLADLPKTLYIQNYQDSSFHLVCNFEEDSDIKQGPTEHILLDARHMSVWKEDKNSVTHTWNDYGLHLEWRDTTAAEYSIMLPEYNAKNAYLQFDIMDINQKVLSEDNIRLLDATIEMEDSKGNLSSLCMSDYYDIYPPLPVKLFKLQFLTGTNDHKKCFQTVQLSTKDFENNNVDFDSSSIVKIIFRFDKNESGKIMIDNIGFGR